MKLTQRLLLLELRLGVLHHERPVLRLEQERRLLLLLGVHGRRRGGLPLLLHQERVLVVKLVAVPVHAVGVEARVEAPLVRPALPAF